MKKIYLEMIETRKEIDFIIVDQTIQNTNSNLLLLEEEIPDLAIAISEAAKFAKYYDIFYPEYIKNIRHY